MFLGRLSLLRCVMSVKFIPFHLHTSAHLHKDRQYLTTILLGRFSLSAIAEMSLKAFIRLRSLAFICRAANKKYHLKFPEPTQHTNAPITRTIINALSTVLLHK